MRDKRAMRAWWLLAVVALAACRTEAGGRDAREPERDGGERDGGERDGGARADAASVNPNVELELGQGELAFAPLADGETLPTVAGGQGGHHVYVSFRMRGLDPIRVLIAVTTVVEGHPELELLARRGRQSFMPESAADPDDDAGTAVPTDRFVYTGWPAQIREATMHRGERARIDVRLEDRNGLTANASKTIVIGDPRP